jgi:bifunctional non-homologous end joining protein LigD
MKTPFPVELLTEVSRETAENLLRNKSFWLQKKLDGHRRQFARTVDGELISYNRKGESVSYPNQLRVPFERIPWRSFLMDGELVGDVFYVFDLLQANGVVIAPQPYQKRFGSLSDLSNRLGGLLRLTPTFWTTKTKCAAMADYKSDRAEGVVFRRINAPYRASRCDQHFKFKFTKTASCVVTSVGREGKATMDIALIDFEKVVGSVVDLAKCLIPVGSCSTNGKDTPEPGQIVEVRYLYATEAMRLYQPIFMRLRDDQTVRDCGLTQLEFKEGIL